MSYTTVSFAPTLYLYGLFLEKARLMGLKFLHIDLDYWAAQQYDDNFWADLNAQVESEVASINSSNAPWLPNFSISLESDENLDDLPTTEELTDNSDVEDVYDLDTDVELD